MEIFLRYENYTLEESEYFPKQCEAIEAFWETAKELARYGQRITATLHRGEQRDPVEYPDWILEYDEEKDRVRIERA